MKSIFILAILSFVSAKNYEGYKVYTFTPETQDQAVYIKSLATSPDFDFWTEVNKVGNNVTVMASPKVQRTFADYLKVHNIPHEVTIENVESVLNEEKEYHRSRPQLKSGRISFTQYARHSEINDYLVQLVRDYPNLVSTENIGQSLEGRNMVVIRISTGRTNPPKPVIFVDAGIHAREWIAPATALYLISQLVENAQNQNLIQNVDWIILPSANPDGYEYSWTSDRLWRKTRSPGALCYGCDPNRNFDYHWMEEGASAWECSETYAGSRAFSELETRNLRDYILKTPNIRAYITLHSYGQYILYPWGYSSVLPPNWRELDALGRSIGQAISNVAGTGYTVGSSTNVLYAAAGASDDWAMGVAGIDLVYCLELPGGGSYGFDLPASRIAGVARETFQGFRVLADYVVANSK